MSKPHASVPLSSQESRHFKLRNLKRQPLGESRTNDDIHKSIHFCPVLETLIDTPHMQRLRHLKQLGVTEMTYINCTHNRFVHSFGTAHLAEALIKKIAKKQPQLGIHRKDILCIKLAGLLHDIGHGPFSHVYDGPFRYQLNMARKEGSWLGYPFTQESYHGDFMEGWQHEDASLMMIDDMLRYLGLEIDYDNLDKPLKQIGDGIRAETFGIYDHNESDSDTDCALSKDNILTSRDWIFIKECIVAGPLPRKGYSIKRACENGQTLQLLGRPNDYQEFLYDIVSNRHSGLDVDKMDYLARDSRHAFGEAGNVDRMFIDNAFVTWAPCPKPDTCFRCQLKNKLVIADMKQQKEHEGMHLMICYPDKMVENVIGFFKKRFSNHSKLYTHPKSKAAEYMVCDILTLADPFFRITYKENNTSQSDAEYEQTPISRAMINPKAYLLLKDNILSLIEHSVTPELEPARQLIYRYNAHDRNYKKIAEEKIVSDDNFKSNIKVQWQRMIWEMPESQFASEIVKSFRYIRHKYSLESLNVTEELLRKELIIEKREIHHGMKNKNPVNYVFFLPKSQLSKLSEPIKDLPIARKINEEEYECNIPRKFLQRTLRIFCRAEDKEIRDLLTTCYHQFIEFMKKKATRVAEDEDDSNHFHSLNILSQSPRTATNDGMNVFSRNSFDDNQEYQPSKKRQKKSLFSSLSFTSP